MYTLKPPFRQVIRDRDKPLVPNSNNAVTANTIHLPDRKNASISKQR